MREPHRITPVLDADAMKTYAVVSPLATHWRPASCEEVACPNHTSGWRTVIDEATDLGAEQAAYIRTRSGRRFVEHRDAALTVFDFHPGQRCFAQHQQPLEREPIYLVRDGDWRGNPRGTPTRRHVSAQEWVEDFANHQDRLATRLERS
jgi:hypothetical protein